MDSEFCSHLEKYGRLFEDSEQAYQSCLDLMDEVFAGAHDPALKDRIQQVLNEWETLTRNLRSTFVSLTDKGHVLLPSEGQNPGPVCAHCGLEVPRLEFAEFEFKDDGSVLFRGQLLHTPELVSV